MACFAINLITIIIICVCNSELKSLNKALTKGFCVLALLRLALGLETDRYRCCDQIDLKWSN